MLKRIRSGDVWLPKVAVSAENLQLVSSRYLLMNTSVFWNLQKGCNHFEFDSSDTCLFSLGLSAN